MHSGWSRIASYLAKITSREEIISFQTSTGKWLLISICNTFENSYICTEVERWNSEILAAKNTTETSSCKLDLKKIQARTGFEPMTSAIPVQRSTNWANKPTGSWSMNWVQINIQVNDDFRYIGCKSHNKIFWFQVQEEDKNWSLFFNKYRLTVRREWLTPWEICWSNSWSKQKKRERNSTTSVFVEHLNYNFY